ncbi:hypothetical protein ACNFIA_16965 [Pseudomonas sp. NY15437]|uniref:hypothetical protein n=1 Tax=Pseudomonas sp. NY15437 TaxID=3400360 RepID=UPI003A84C3CB
MTITTDPLVNAKVGVLETLDLYLQVIHDFADEDAFERWWFKNGDEDLGLTSEQVVQIFRELKVQVYTFKSCLAEYRRILTGNPDKALRLDDYHYAYLTDNGDLIGLGLSRDGTIAEAEPFDFDGDAFNSCIGGWMGENYLDTLSHISAAVLVDVPCKF